MVKRNFIYFYFFCFLKILSLSFGKELTFESLDKDLNFSFEYAEERKPVNWSIVFRNKEYGEIIIDEENSIDGKNSLRIENLKGTVLITSAANFSLKELRKILNTEKIELELSVYIKGENVSGYPFIAIDWWRQSIAGWISKVEKKCDLGNFNWKKINLLISEIPQEANFFRVQCGVYSLGGKIWFDNFNLKINGRDIRDIYREKFEQQSKSSNFAFLLKNDFNCQVWYEIATKKVFPYSLPPSIEKEKIIIKAARNEYETFQLVFRSINKNKFQVYFSDFKKIDDFSKVINKENISYYEVGYVSIPFEDKIPDPLLPISSLYLEPLQTKSIFITFYIPKSVDSGIYKGEIIVENNLSKFKIPVEIQIWDFELPQKSSLEIIANLWMSPIRRFDKREEKEILKDYFPLLSSHRIRGISIGLPTIKFQNSEEISLKEDSVEYFKEKIELCRKFGFDIFLTSAGPWINSGLTYIGQLKWNPEQFWTPKELNYSIKIMSPEFKKYYVLYHQLLSHLFEKIGIRENCLLYIYDEPDWEAIVNLREICKWISEIKPSLRIFMTTVPTELLNPYVDVWCLPALALDKNIREIKRFQQQGQKIYLYHNYLYLINEPILNARIMPWILFKYDLDGYLFWSVNAWGENPWIKVKSFGDGYLFYPNPKEEGPPYLSLRLELWREGLEDYEYFSLLQKEINLLMKNGKIFKIEEYKEIQNALDILKKIDVLIKNVENYSTEPTDYLSLREEIGNSIQKIRKIKEVYNIK